jgi:hypothetical protein
MHTFGKLKNTHIHKCTFYANYKTHTTTNAHFTQIKKLHTTTNAHFTLIKKHTNPENAHFTQLKNTTTNSHSTQIINDTQQQIQIYGN